MKKKMLNGQFSLSQKVRSLKCSEVEIIQRFPFTLIDIHQNEIEWTEKMKDK